MTLQEQQAELETIHSDPQAFGAVFDRYYLRIFNYIFRRVTDYDLARDLAAETFLKAFLKIKDFRWQQISLSSWLYKIATNEIKYHFRKQQYLPFRQSQLPDQYPFDMISAQDYLTEKQQLEEELEAHQEFMEVQQALKQLPAKYQDVMALRYFESKSIREIAEILGKKEGTVKSLLSRGLGKLRILVSDATET